MSEQIPMAWEPATTTPIGTMPIKMNPTGTSPKAIPLGLSPHGAVNVLGFRGSARSPGRHRSWRRAVRSSGLAWKSCRSVVAGMHGFTMAQSPTTVRVNKGIDRTVVPTLNALSAIASVAFRRLMLQAASATATITSPRNPTCGSLMAQGCGGKR